jgi:hypothetical protein
VLPVAASILVAAIRPKKLWNKAEAEHAPRPLQQGTSVKGGREFQSGLERSDSMKWLPLQQGPTI